MRMKLSWRGGRSKAERAIFDGGRRTTQLMRDSLGRHTMNLLILALIPPLVGALVAYYFFFKALRARTDEGRENTFLAIFWGAVAPLRYFTPTGNRYRLYAILSLLLGVGAGELVRQLVFH